MNIRIELCDAFNDERGDLVQFITRHTLQNEKLDFGQVYLLTFAGKGVVRGNHYHNHSSEMFCLIAGEVEMVFEDVETRENQRLNIAAKPDYFQRIFVGEKTAHAIRSVSDFAVLVSFSSHEYDKSNADKQPYILMQ